MLDNTSSWESVNNGALYIKKKYFLPKTEVLSNWIWNALLLVSKVGFV